MGDESQRQVRLRLARQRPVPDRVRARVREATPEPQWWRRVSWAHVGTVVGVLAAIGSLIFTAVATYYSAAVSQDQLQQSREDSDREIRQQAMLVTAWADRPSGRWQVHVLNRALDPVTQTAVWVVVRKWRPHSGGRDTHLVSSILDVGVVAPCTELVYSEANLRVLAGEQADPDARPGDETFPGTEGVVVEYAYFVDRDGKMWQHGPGELALANGIPVPTPQGPNQRSGPASTNPVVKPASVCGTSAS